MQQSPKKKFKVNGAILNPQEVFYASFKKWNEENLMKAVEENEYAVLINPSQSGKTTRIYEFLNQIEEKKTYIGVYITMELLIDSPKRIEKVSTENDDEQQEITNEDFSKKIPCNGY